MLGRTRRGRARPAEWPAVQSLCHNSMGARRHRCEGQRANDRPLDQARWRLGAQAWLSAGVGMGPGMGRHERRSCSPAASRTRHAGFRPMPLRWVKSLLPGPYVPGVLQSQRIGGALSCPFAYRLNLERKLHYMLKAATVETGRRLNLGRAGHTSIVFGKRAGVSQASRSIK